MLSFVFLLTHNKERISEAYVKFPSSLSILGGRVWPYWQKTETVFWQDGKKKKKEKKKPNNVRKELSFGKVW